MLALFTTSVHASVLGALLTFSPRVWYPHYLEVGAPGGLTALGDQQLGGLIMWMPAGAVYLAAALWLLVLWLRRADGALPVPARDGAADAGTGPPVR